MEIYEIGVVLISKCLKCTKGLQKDQKQKIRKIWAKHPVNL